MNHETTGEIHSGEGSGIDKTGWAKAGWISDKTGI